MIQRRLLAAIALVSGATALADDPRELAPDQLPQHLVKILRTTNKAQTNRYVPKVYDLKHVNPYAVIRFFRRVMEVEEGAWFSFASPDLSSGKVLVVCPEYQLPGLDELISTIDQPNLTSRALIPRLCYRLRHRDALDAGAIATAAIDGTTAAVLIPDIQLNAWFVEDTPSGLERIQSAVVDRIDVPTPQVEATITVYEVAYGDDGQLGLDYLAWKNGPGRNLFAIGAFAEKEKISTLGGGSDSLVFHSGKGTFGLPGREFTSTGRNGAYLIDVPSAYFDFLATRGRARVLTRSRVAALNGATAVLEVGDDIPYFKVNHTPDQRGGARLAPLDPFGDLDQVFAADGAQAAVADFPDNRTVVPATTSRSLAFAQAGFFLQFTPTINQSVTLLDVFASFVDLTGFADDGTPVLAARSVDTRFKVPADGREITLGAKARKRRVDSANKIPWLGDIPVLGTLFGGESHLDQTSLVVVTMRLDTQRFPYADQDRGVAPLQRMVHGESGVVTEPVSPGFLGQ